MNSIDSLFNKSVFAGDETEEREKRHQCLGLSTSNDVTSVTANEAGHEETNGR